MAGLRLVQKIQNKLPRYWRITLIDQSLVHVFPADLYQVATVFNEEITEECMLALKETVATPISRLVDPWRVDFVRNTAVGIDPKKKRILLKEGSPLHYDALVVALGSVHNDFGVPGVKKYGFPLKTVSDALKINCHIDQLFLENWKKNGECEVITISVAGGGPTGVETAAELIGTLKHLCKKYDYPADKVKVELIQGGTTLAGFKKKGTRLILKQLKKMGVNVLMKHRVLELKKGSVMVRDPEGETVKCDADMLIWTAGVRVNPVVAKSLGSEELRGGIAVDEYLQAVEHEDVFALGDNAMLENPNAKGYLPMTAQVAMTGADILGANLCSFLKSRHFRGGQRWKIEKMRFLKKMPSKTYPYLVPVGHRFALFQMGQFVFESVAFVALKSLIGLRYSWSIMPLRKAYKKWRGGNKIFVTND